MQEWRTRWWWKVSRDNPDSDRQRRTLTQSLTSLSHRKVHPSKRSLISLRTLRAKFINQTSILSTVVTCKVVQRRKSRIGVRKRPNRGSRWDPPEFISYTPPQFASSESSTTQPTPSIVGVMSIDPYHAVQQEIQNSLHTAAQLQSSFLRIRSMANTDSEELMWARNEVRSFLPTNSSFC